MHVREAWLGGGAAEHKQRPQMLKVKILELREFKRRVVAGSFPKFERLSDALKGMKFLQADPIRSPARAQDLILRQRVTGYLAGELEREFPNLQSEEGYLFAYGFMTPEVWSSLRYRPRRQLNWLEREVLEAVKEFGEVHPRVLGERFGRKSIKNYWGGHSQETKRILESLHLHGHLRVSRRENGIRIYQLAEQSNDEMTGPRERYCHLALTTGVVFGPATRQFLVSELRSHNHLLPVRKDRLAAVESLVESGQLTEVEAGGVTYLWRSENFSSEEVPERVRILAPFDPLVRDRERFCQLWGWQYRFEAYVPAAKRERGYYAMPVMWKDEVIGWANAKVEQKCLQVQFGYHSKQPRSKAFRRQAEIEVESITRFLGLQRGAWNLEHL